MKALVLIIFSVCIFQFANAQHSSSPQRTSREEVLIYTDRFSSSIEQKLTSLIRTEIGVLARQVQRCDQTQNIDNVLKNIDVLKNSVQSIQDECLEKSIFDTAPVNNSKIDNIQLSVASLRQSAYRVEKELATIKRSMRTMGSNNQPVLYSSGNLFHDNYESACIADLHLESGIRRIRKDFFVFCKVTQDDGNWIVISNRYDGSMNFLRNWQDYKEGFGNIAGEFWLGLEKIYQLVSLKPYELRIDMEAFNGDRRTAKYSAFGISSEASGYALNILGHYSGDAGDCLTYHAGMKFSTIDVDNDEWPEGSCSKSHFGGWWYNKCDMANINGLYNNSRKNDNEYQGMYWKYDNVVTLLKSVNMMIRPVD